MSDQQLQYVLGKNRYMNAENLSGNIKINFPSTSKPIPESDVTELVSLAQRYDRERQASPLHRIYGRLCFIATNELTDYTSSTLILSDQTTNYNLQLLYPSSSTNNLTLSDFSCDVFPLTCSYYDNVTDCANHKIYHGLPFINSRQVTSNGRTSVALSTYNHKYANNIAPDDYVYIIPGKDGTNNQLYGIFRVTSVALDDGTPNVLVLDKNVTGNYGGSYKKIVNPSDNDIRFLNTIGCELYVTATTSADLFVRCNEKHNAIVGDFIDLRQTGTTTFNQYNGVHKVGRIVNDLIYVCNVPSHMFSTPAPTQVPDIINMNPVTFSYQYRVLDGVPSEYYVRKFKVLVAGDNTTTIYDMDYYLQQLYLSHTIWKNVEPPVYLSCGTIKQSGSDDDRVNSFVFNMDVNISSYADNLGRPLTELYLGIIKRKDATQFNNLITNFQGGLMYSGITVFNKALNLPTYVDPNVKSPLDYFAVAQFNDAGFNLGGDYYGDLCEFSVDTLTETTLDPLQFRIGKIIDGYDVEGYVYEPFKKIRLRYFSTDIDEPDYIYDEIPNYAIPYHNTYRWRNINPYGFKDVADNGVNVVDAPFVNGAHYDFSNVDLYLRRQDKNVDVRIVLYDTSC